MIGSESRNADLTSAQKNSKTHREVTEGCFKSTIWCVRISPVCIDSVNIMTHSAVINKTSPLLIPSPISFQGDSGSSHSLMVDDHPKTAFDYSDTLIMRAASKYDIISDNIAELIPTIAVHKFTTCENLLSVHYLTSKGYEALLGESSDKIYKHQKCCLISKGPIRSVLANSYWIHVAQSQVAVGSKETENFSKFFKHSLCWRTCLMASRYV